MQQKIGNCKQADGNCNNQKKMLEIKNIVTEMKVVFDGFIYRLYPAKKRNSESEDMSVETFKTEIQRGKNKE